VLFAAIPCAASACDLPRLVLIPQVTTEEAALEARTATEAYHAAMLAYADCVRAELVAAGGDAAPANVKQALIVRHNYAVAEVQAVLELFEKNVTAKFASARPNGMSAETWRRNIEQSPNRPLAPQPAGLPGSTQ
jgi:hypothetical protein